MQSLGTYKDSVDWVEQFNQRMDQFRAEKEKQDIANAHRKKIKNAVLVVIGCVLEGILLYKMSVGSNAKAEADMADITVVSAKLNNQTFSASGNWSEGFSVRYHYFKLVFKSDNTVTVYSLLRTGPMSNSDSLDLLGTYQYKLKKNRCPNIFRSFGE